MNGMQLIPANSKKSMLYFGMFKMLDIGIFLGGAGFSFLLFLILSPNNIWAMVGIFMPGFICAMLVMPVPNHHNVRTFIGIVFKFITENKKYSWKGWCIADGSDDE